MLRAELQVRNQPSGMQRDVAAVIRAYAVGFSYGSQLLHMSSACRIAYRA